MVTTSPATDRPHKAAKRYIYAWGDGTAEGDGGMKDGECESRATDEKKRFHGESCPKTAGSRSDHTAIYGRQIRSFGGDWGEKMVMFPILRAARSRAAIFEEAWWAAYRASRFPACRRYPLSS